jgi:pimeloyl-ACP methyl ester carboxylesterase
MRRVLFLGGNGHCSDRLEPAQSALDRAGRPFELLGVPYPGFEGRPRTSSFDAFLDSVGESIHELSGLPDQGEANPTIYATGIGGLFAIALRARGAIIESPILMQAPVLWGLERRLFPWLMRRGLWRLFPRIIGSRRFQNRFARTKFTHRPTPEMLKVFFDGYQSCEATTDFFHWLTPSLLRDLEREFSVRPKSLERIRFWWGGRDAVVSLSELRVTERALGRTWPVRQFPEWGHYPMIDDPDGWVRSLADELATAG